jgi:hypothetical protein
MVPELTLPIEQGASFDHTLNWYGGGKFIAPIEDIVPGYPTRIKVTGHSLNATSPTPVIISGANAQADDDGDPVAFRNLNSIDTGIDLATRIDDDWFEMPVSTVGEIWYPGTGEITYWQPSDITDWGGECTIRKNWHSPVFHTISTELGTMTLDGTDGSIRLEIDAVDTAAFNFVNAVFDIDLWPSGGARPTTPGNVIMRIFKGTVKMYRDS